MESTFSHYTILEELGRGGMGVVYKARDERLERIVALKVLAGELADDPKFRERFLKEARLASSLQHPRICTIHEIDTTEDGKLFISMDYYEGETLQKKIFKGIDSLDVMLDYAIQLSEGIAAAHKKGVIHRDIKPENVIITTEGEVKILDFGMSKLNKKYISAQTSRILGSVSYISPEQVQGQPVDLLTDIWSFGVVLYEMATGILPFGHESEAAIIYAILDKSPVPPTEINEDLPDQLGSLILQCLRKNKSERYQSMDEVHQELLTLWKGLNKTEALDKAVDQEQKRPSGKRRLKVRTKVQEEDIIKTSKGWKIASYVSFVVVIAIACILLYPKIFTKDKLSDLRNEEGIISLAVLPFENMTNDTLWDVWEGGIQNELITHLSNSRELSVRQYRTTIDILQSSDNISFTSISTSVAGDISRKLHVSTFILGSIKSTGDRFRVSAHLIDANTEETYKTFQLDGNEEGDVFRVTDSLSNLIRNYLEIKAIEKEGDPIISNFGTETNSAEAFRYYFQGYNLFMSDQYVNSIELFNRALEIDSSFFLPGVFKVIALVNLAKDDEAKLLIQKLNEVKEDVPYNYQLFIEYLDTFYDKDDPRRSLKYLELILENDPYQRNFWYDKGHWHSAFNQYQQAIECYEKALEIDRQWGVNWEWVHLYTRPGKIYHELNNHKREKELYELGLSVLPDHPQIVYRQAVCALSKGDTTAANMLIEKYKSIMGQQRRSIQTLVSVGRIYEEADYLEEAEKLFRQAYGVDKQNDESTYELAYFLIKHEISINEGIELISSALETEPENWDFLFSKGLGLNKQGKIEEAYKMLSNAWDLRPYYNHEHYLVLQEVEQALTNHNQ